MNETEILFSEILNCNRLSLYLNKDLKLDKDKSYLISNTFKRRMSGEPLQYILGKTEFMGLEFKITPDVFIPRPETEILVEKVLEIATSYKLQATSQNILDIGTGSGNIAVSLAKLLKDCRVTVVDISQEAINVAKDNALLNNVAGKIDFINLDFFNLRPATCVLRLAAFDIIVSNPPYIPSEEIENLQPEIRFEPYIALDGGRDGLDFYRGIIDESPKYLKRRGFLIMEIGFKQREPIENIFQDYRNFEIIEVIKDYNNIDRVIVAQSK